MRTVVIRQGALGDFILTLPLLKALAQRGDLIVIAPARFHVLLPEDMPLSAFVDCDSAATAELFAPAGQTPAASSRWADLPRGAEVHLFTRQPNLPPATRCRALGASAVVCHEPRPTTTPHAACQFLLNAACEVPDLLLQTPIMPRSSRSAGHALWIHCGSGSIRKNIPPDFWAEAARDQQRQSASDLILSFGEADLEFLDDTRHAFAKRQMPFHEILCPTLAELKSKLAEHAALFWSADTGVAHLAAALGITTHVWFRQSNPDIWKPCGRVTVHFYS